MSAAAETQDPKQLIAALRQLQHEAREHPLDVEAVQAVTQALFEHYAGSPEAAAFDQPLEGPEIFGQCAALHHGRTLIALGEGHLDAVLFKTLPAKVSAGPEVARPIVDTMRSLYVWLKREHAVFEADEMIELLGDDAVREFEDCLSDPELAGPVKSMLMDAMAAGVDLSDERAIKAFLNSKVGTRLPDGPLSADGPFGFGYDDFNDQPSPSRPSLTPEQQRSQQKKRKKDRKSARKSRKKNR